MNITLKNEINHFLKSVPSDKRRDVTEAAVGFALAAHMDIPSSELEDPRTYFNDLYADPTKAALSDIVESIPMDPTNVFNYVRNIWLFSYNMVWDRKDAALIFMLMCAGSKDNKVSELGKAINLLSEVKGSNGVLDMSHAYELKYLIEATEKYYGVAGNGGPHD